MRKIILATFLAAIIFIFGCTKSPEILDGSGKFDDNVRVINIKASRFNFEPNTIIVNKGEVVRLIIKSQDVAHGFALPDFNINEQVPAGKQVTIEFTASKQGTFPFLCTVYCGEGHSSMKGDLTVK